MVVVTALRTPASGALLLLPQPGPEDCQIPFPVLVRTSLNVCGNSPVSSGKTKDLSISKNAAQAGALL